MLAQVMDVELKNPLSSDRYILTMHAPTGWEFPLPGVVVDYAGDYAFVSWQEALESIVEMRRQSASARSYRPRVTSSQLTLASIQPK